MTKEVPELFDFVKTTLADTRAHLGGAETFLLDRVSEDLTDRLAPVLRDFDRVLDFGTPFGAFGKALSAARTIGQPDMRALTASDAGLPEAHYALALSGMVMHRVNDLPGFLIQLGRTLKPDGLLIAAFPGGDTLTELRDALMAAEIEVRGAAGLRVFPMIDVRAAGQLLQRAGFALPVVDSDRLTVRYADLFALIRDIRAMGGTATPLHRPGQPGLTRAIILRAAEIYRERYADPDGRIRATFEIIWISGWVPHASQQKPLKPGSAKMRLEEALKQIENQK